MQTPTPLSVREGASSDDVRRELAAQLPGAEPEQRLPHRLAVHAVGLREGPARPAGVPYQEEERPLCNALRRARVTVVHLLHHLPLGLPPPAHPAAKLRELEANALLRQQGSKPVACPCRSANSLEAVLLSPREAGAGAAGQAS